MFFSISVKLTGTFMFFVFFALHSLCFETPNDETKGNVGSNPLRDLLNIAESALRSAKHYVTDGKRLDLDLYVKPMDCSEIFEKDASSKSGIYQIWPRSRIIKGPVTAYCDMDDDGGAWTVIQRRGDFDSEKNYFYRDWISYKNGFGDPTKDFWIGNDNIFALTNGRACTLKFTLSDWEANITYALYDKFWIDDEAHNYEMHVTGYRGNAGDGFSYTNGLSFTTKDNDHDLYEKNCAVLYKGGWWYGKCHSSNVNGLYLKGVHESYADGVNWSPFRGNHYSLKDTVIKIRPKDFIKAVGVNITPQ